MWPALISAGANIIGGLLGKSSADDARAQQQNLANQNMALQREFAQNGIQWRVEDAKKAGIHPIYALGGSGASYSPVSANFTPDMSMANAMSSAGQNIGRAMAASSTEPQRQTAFTNQMQGLQLERAQLENETLRQGIMAKQAVQSGPQVGPPMAAAADAYLVPGQTQSGLVKQKPLETAPAPSNAPYAEGGAVADVGYARTTTGWAPVPSKDVKEKIEDNEIQEIGWAMRNNFLPSIGKNLAPPPFKAPEGKAWVYDFFRQEYRLNPIVESKFGYGKRPAGWYIR